MSGTGAAPMDKARSNNQKRETSMSHRYTLEQQQKEVIPWGYGARLRHFE